MIISFVERYRELNDELILIKYAIKYGWMNHTINGKSMADWGWMTIEEHNKIKK